MAKRKKLAFVNDDVFFTGHMNLVNAHSLAEVRGLKNAIAAEEIARRLTVAVNRRIDNVDDPVGKYIRGGASALRAFPAALNAKGLFAIDNITFRTGAFDACTTIGQVGGVIVRHYVLAGWNVT